MASLARALLAALALVGAACGSSPTASNVVCEHHAMLAEKYGLLLARDGSDTARCVKDLERDRHKLGEEAYAAYASCLLAASSLPEWMACDPAPRSAGDRGRVRP